MFKLFQNLFSKETQATSMTIDHKNDKQQKQLESYFSKELKNSPYFKPECSQQILDHLLHQRSLTKTENNLTNEEKQFLGINTRLIITKELIQVLSTEGLGLANPKLALEEIYNAAVILKARVDNFERAKQLGIKKYKLNSSGGGGDCEWCQSSFLREFGEDILQQMQENCICKPYSKSFIKPIIEFGG